MEPEVKDKCVHEELFKAWDDDNKSRTCKSCKKCILFWKPNEAYPITGVNAQFKFLQGKVLTVIDAVFPEGEQRKAIKDLINKSFSEQLNHVNGVSYGSGTSSK